jgi:hypothetical protein
MTDDASTGNDDQGTAAKAPAFTPPASQADLDRIIGERVARERGKFADYDDLKTKAAEYDKAAEATKSEIQKATERAEAAERRAKDAEVTALRAEVASAKGVPLTALAGNTRDELEKAADSILSWRDEAAKSKTLNPKGGFKSGASKSDQDAMTPKQAAAAAMRAMRPS